MTESTTGGPRFRTLSASPEEILGDLAPHELRAQLGALQSVTDGVLAHLDLHDLLEELLARLRTSLDVDAAAVLLCTEDGSELTVEASIGLEDDPDHARVPAGEGIAGTVATRRTPVIVDDVARAEPVRPVLRKLSSMMVAPLHAAGDFLGVVHVGVVQPRTFTEAELYLLQVATDRAALAIRSAMFLADLQEEASARERAHAARLEIEERFRVYSESASDAIFAMDDESIIQYANEAVERVFGYSPDELVGHSMTDLIPERMREAHRRGVQNYVATGEKNIPWSGVQLPGLHRDGHEIPLEISFGSYTRGGRRYFTGIARDITERVRHQQQLEQLAAELETTVEELKARTSEAEAGNQAKTNFMAVMSHELRTPLSAIMGYADLLRLGVPEAIPDAARKQVDRIDAAARHQLALIEEILTFSRLQAGQEEVKSEDVELIEVARDALSFVEPLAEKAGVELAFDAPDAPLRVRSDGGRVRQILTNLLSNALKFTPEGTVRLRLGTMHGGVVLAVEDEGIGIAPEDMEKIFDPFWQVQQGNTREIGGTGLGLTVSQRIAQLLGGHISVESTPGEGSTFTLHLPLDPGG